jgi:hypothetical protein
MLARTPSALAGLLILASLSGGVDAGPRTPPPLSGLPVPYLGTAVLGGSGPAAAVDAYGQIVDLRARPAGAALISNPYERQRFGTVEPGTGWALEAGAGENTAPLWKGTQLRQSYLPRSNVLRTTGTVGDARIRSTDAVLADPGLLARRVRVVAPRGRPLARVEAPLPGCRRQSERRPGRLSIEIVCPLEGHAPALSAAGVVDAAARADRAWLSRRSPLAADAPAWARRLHDRSLLVLRALTDRRSGVQAAGARDFWAYVWPRDAATGAIALAAAGYRTEAKRITRFLVGLDRDGAARFIADGRGFSDDREAPGDADGWTAAAALATGIDPPVPGEWRGRQDYGEDDEGDHLGNAIASGLSANRILSGFDAGAGLIRRSGKRESGLDSAAAWAASVFPQPGLADAARQTLLTMAAGAGRFGIEPTDQWPGDHSWTAPTAWAAWGLARLGEDAAADRLLGALRRSRAQPGTLPERVSPADGVARSTTPLAWSHAMAVLALRARYAGGQQPSLDRA